MTMKCGGIRIFIARNHDLMRLDHEELILRNACLQATAFWQFSRAYALRRAAGDAPQLPYFPVAAALLLHKATVEKIRNMWFDSGLAKAISDRPEILAGLQGRVEANAARAFDALQVGCASGILMHEGGSGFPAFRAEGTDLPKALRDAPDSVSGIYAGARRLGTWFADEGLSSVYARLNLRF
jgi:hypothetical protein